MNAKQMLKAAGCSDTVAGKKKFYDMYPTPAHFFAKHGGELSGAPHNGQPTAAEFFAWGHPVIGPQGFYANGGQHVVQNGKNTEYDRALALVTKAMGGQAGVMSGDEQSDYLTQYLNQNSLNNMRQGGNLMQARNGVDIGGPNAPEQGSSQSTNYSDGYTGQNNNPNYYRQGPSMFGYGYNPAPYMGIWGAIGSAANRTVPKIKVKQKFYGDINYGSQQQGAQGSQGSSTAPRNIDEASSQGSSQKQAPKNNGAPEGYTPYEEVIKRGFWNRVAPNKFAPKHTRVGYERTGQGNNVTQINPASGSGTPNGGGSGAGTNSKKPFQQNTQMSPYEAYMSGQGSMPKNAYPMQGANGGRYMGPDINESDTNLPAMNINRKSPFGAGFPAMYGPQEVTSDDYSAQSNYSPFTVFGDQPMGPSKADGSYRRGGMVPKFVDGGNGFYTPNYRDQTDIYGGMGFDWSNLNPDNIMGVAQDGTDFLENAQHTRLVNERNAALTNPLNTTAYLENKGSQKEFDSNIESNRTARLTNFAGDANVDGQIGMSRYGGTMQGGGAVQVGDVVDDWSEDELAQFLANGGQVEFIDEE